MSNNPFGMRNDSPMANNPFALNSAASRYPPIDGGNQTPYQQAYIPTMGYQQPQYYPQNPPPSQPSQSPPPQPLFPAYGQSPSVVGLGPQSSFAPQSPYGRQVEDQLGTSNAYSPYVGAPSQDSGARAQTFSAYTDLDSLAQLPWAQPTLPPDVFQQLPQSPTAASFGGASWNDDHPRAFVRDHKNELESWRPEAWKQFRESVENLRQAWIGRKELVLKAMQGYGTQWDPVDAKRVQDLLQEADNNIDQITASSLQLQEAETGYRHSRDATSRSRVRENLNAGLKSLPEWPEPLQTSKGGTMSYNAPPLQDAAPISQQQFSQHPRSIQPSFTGWNGPRGGVQPSNWQQQPFYPGYPPQ